MKTISSRPSRGLVRRQKVRSTPFGTTDAGAIERVEPASSDPDSSPREPTTPATSRADANKAWCARRMSLRSTRRTSRYSSRSDGRAGSVASRICPTIRLDVASQRSATSGIGGSADSTGIVRLPLNSRTSNGRSDARCDALTPSRAAASSPPATSIRARSVSFVRSDRGPRVARSVMRSSRYGSRAATSSALWFGPISERSVIR